MAASLLWGHLLPPVDALGALLDFTVRKQLKAATDIVVGTWSLPCSPPCVPLPALLLGFQ